VSKSLSLGWPLISDGFGLVYPWQIEYGKRWPMFGFEKHKGYGTRAHHEAIREHGMVEIHRRSFLKKMEAAGGKLAEYKG